MGTELIPLGTLIRVTQVIELGPASLRLAVIGRLCARERFQTSSSFIGQEGGRYWLERITIEKPDGERSALVIDQNTKIEPVAETGPLG